MPVSEVQNSVAFKQLRTRSGSKFTFLCLEGVRFTHKVKSSVDRWLNEPQRPRFLFDKITSMLSLSATIKESVSSLFLQLCAFVFGVYASRYTHTNLLPAELLSACCRLLFQRRETRDICVSLHVSLVASSVFANAH